MFIHFLFYTSFVSGTNRLIQESGFAAFFPTGGSEIAQAIS